MRTIKVDEVEYFRLESCVIEKVKEGNLYRIVPIKKEQDTTRDYVKDLKDIFGIFN